MTRRLFGFLVRSGYGVVALAGRMSEALVSAGVALTMAVTLSPDIFVRSTRGPGSAWTRHEALVGLGGRGWNRQRGEWI